MKLNTLDGLQYKWMNGKEKGQGKVSSLHELVRKIMQEEFPLLSYSEEVPIMILRGKWLYFDFYVPLFKTAIEVHGQQHYSYSSFFHKNIDNFLAYRKNDILKVEFCEKNNLNIVELKYDESSEWRDTIRRVFKPS